MAVRNLLHRNKVEEFIKWLGEYALPPCGQWEIVRWAGKRGQPMRIIYDNTKSPQHVSCGDAAYHDVRRFLNGEKYKEDDPLSLLEEWIELHDKQDSLTKEEYEDLVKRSKKVLKEKGRHANVFQKPI